MNRQSRNSAGRSNGGNLRSSGSCHRYSLRARVEPTAMQTNSADRKRKKDQNENDAKVRPAKRSSLRQKTTEHSHWFWLLDSDGNPLANKTATEMIIPDNITSYSIRKPEKISSSSKRKHRNHKDTIQKSSQKRKGKPTESLDHPSDDIDDRWMKMFQRLCKYQKRNDAMNNGWAEVKIYQAPPKQKELGHWMLDQRCAYCRGSLAKPKIKLLRSLGCDLGTRITFHWMTMYERLLRFKEEHGHCNVPYNFSDYTLARWICTQRMNRVTTEQAFLMEEIGFEWRPLENAWMNMYKELVKFVKKHGHTMVPRDYADNPKLGQWVSMQRCRCKEDHRIDLLNELGFEWNAIQGQWMELYWRLVEYKNKHGNTTVSPRKHPKLGWWVFRHRLLYKTNEIKKQHYDLLNKIGFNWVPKPRQRNTPKI